MIQYGLDRIGTFSSLFKGKRLGLAITGSSVNSSFSLSYEVVKSQYHVVALYGPEHGFRSNYSAGANVPDHFELYDGIPVHSLYSKESQHLAKEMVQDVDTIVFDIQDLGLRFYTYIATLKNLLQDCALFQKELVVLDRPNPLGGEVVEGNILQPDFFSFVGPYSLPVRYGLTIGELALFLNDRLGYGCNLTVIPLVGWDRSSLFCALSRPWMMTSPAIGHFEGALLYGGMCFLEGTNISEGRGTSCPFELIGAPFIDAEKLCKASNDLHLDAVAFTPVYFNPTADKYAGELCNGLYAHVLDPQAFRPVETAIRLISLIARMYPDDFKILPALEKLLGIEFPETIINDCESVLARWHQESQVFAKEKLNYHLYR
ncbi:DUF1343 domain-containing protein [uncultured Sphaerochaeta sp.]|uniref:DUF1343 domain-containing protein n=1 Tax=uncultured Sphaerochaeta sp. TaxID=886478 RepID=UPI002A0A2469|nr:DUF1343 domain-containing protein [uncultured Sphaerochaeta sp.]